MRFARDDREAIKLWHWNWWVNPELFVMDWEDRACQYGCDGDSRLTL